MRRLPVLILAALPLAGCGDGARSCSDLSFPAPPADAGDPLFVAAGCPADGADGTREHPYSRIGDALAEASAGRTILVAEETTYDEDLVIDKPVHLLGSPPETAGRDATTTIRPRLGPGVVVSKGVTGVEVRGLVIERAKGAGIWVAEGASATLDGIRIHAVELDGDGRYGYGILASEGATASVVRTSIDDAPAIGIYFAGATGSIDEVEVQGVGSHGGIRLEDTTAKVTIREATVSGCGEIGILVASSTAKIEVATISGIRLGASGVGDGIVVMRRRGPDGAYLNEARADIEGAVITQAARVGVMFSDGATGSLAHSTVASCAPSAAFGAGVWLQSGAGGEEGVLVTKSRIRNNTFLGVGLTSGATGRILDNLQIDETAAGLVLVQGEYASVGDGLGVFRGARATVESNVLGSNGRQGAIFDEAGAGTTFAGNQVTDNQGFGLVIQRPTAGIPPFADNDFKGNLLGPTLVLGIGQVPHPVHTADLATP